MPYTEYLGVPLNSLARLLVACGVLCTVLAGRAAAQGWKPPDPSQDPWNRAKLKIGPFYMAPSFDLRNVGIDNNVFRDQGNPRQDLTATIAVSTIFGVHFKAFSLMITQDNRYLWFRRYASERSIDGGLTGLVELRLQNLRPWLLLANLKSTDRSGFEVDTRAARRTPTYEAGVDLSLGHRTGVTAGFSNKRTEYSEAQFFDGVDLKKELDNKQAFAHVKGRWQYSEFTDIVGTVEYARNEFTFDPLRSGSTFSYMVGFQGRGGAPVTGSLNAGYKTQRHDAAGVPDFKGFVLSGSVSTVAFDRLKLDLLGDRDLFFSYDPNYPFYVQQGGGLTVTARVSTRLDLIGSARGEWLRYSESFLTAALPNELNTSRTDTATVLGAGFLYTVGGIAGSHFGLTFERAERMSPLPKKNYRNDRVLTNLKFSF